MTKILRHRQELYQSLPSATTAQFRIVAGTTLAPASKDGAAIRWYRILRAADAGLIGTVTYRTIGDATGWQYLPHNARQGGSRRLYSTVKSVLRGHFPVADRNEIASGINAREILRRAG